MYIETMATAHFPSMSSAREHLKEVLDAAVEGRPVSVTRDRSRVAAVDADRLAHFLRGVRPARAELASEAGGWSLFLTGVPVAATGDSVDEVMDAAVDALRDYAEAWVDRLRTAPNHRDSWSPVQLVELSSDDELKSWLRDE
ncbi:hypothetical protein [Nocardioides sp. B-3]|uniref:hypothetical protein n=1 Tax=Nocardioides sp. B-3 TaxID=2895565 RepID=UPI00300E6CDC